MNHFRDSNVLQQKDKKLRPMIDINYSDIAEIIERQKNETPVEKYNDWWMIFHIFTMEFILMIMIRIYIIYLLVDMI